MKTIKSIIIPILAILLTSSCKEEVTKIMYDSDVIPQAVRDPKVENKPGKVEISYTLPRETSLLYVEAEVDMGQGRIVTSKSSNYNHSLEIAGFGSSREYEVKLYSVGRNLKRSEPVTIKVNPLEPPVSTIFRSLKVDEAFGGMAIEFENDEEAEVSVVVESINENSEWYTVETFYTNKKTDVLKVRGLESRLQSFRIFVNDRWGNRSDILNTELTPIYEVELDRTLFTAMKMPNDPNHWNNAVLTFLLNNNLSGAGSYFRTDNGTPMPTQVTFDMKQQVRLSRFKFWQRGTVAELDLLYTAGSPRDFELWGSNDPNPDGSFDSWTKIADCELTKPSGLPIPNNSPEDIAAAVEGHEYDIYSADIEPMRYFRIRVLRTYGVTDYFWMSLFRLYGQPVN